MKSILQLKTKIKLFFSHLKELKKLNFKIFIKPNSKFFGRPILIFFSLSREIRTFSLKFKCKFAAKKIV